MAQTAEIGRYGAQLRHHLATGMIMLVGLAASAGLVAGDVQGWQWALAQGHSTHRQLLGPDKLSASEYRDASLLGKASSDVLSHSSERLPTPFAAQALVAKDPLFAKYHVYLAKDSGDALSQEAGDSKNEIDVQLANAPGSLTLIAPDWNTRYAFNALLRPGHKPIIHELVRHSNNGYEALMVFLSILSLFAAGLLVQGGWHWGEELRKRGAGQTAWRRLVDSELLGPPQPKEGYTILHPEKEARLAAHGEQVRFLARRYRFSRGQWLDSGEDAALGGDWQEAGDVSAVVGRWVDFCNSVAKRNVASWTARPEGRSPARPQAINAGLSVVNLLPDAREVVDLTAYADPRP